MKVKYLSIFEQFYDLIMLNWRFFFNFYLSFTLLKYLKSLCREYLSICDWAEKLFEEKTCYLSYINMHSVCVNTMNINKMHLSLPLSLTVLNLIHRLVVVVTVTVALASVVSVLILTVWLSVSVLHCCEAHIELCTVELLVKSYKSLSCLFVLLTNIFISLHNKHFMCIFVHFSLFLSHHCIFILFCLYISVLWLTFASFLIQTSVTCFSLASHLFLCIYFSELFKELMNWSSVIHCCLNFCDFC